MELCSTTNGVPDAGAGNHPADDHELLEARLEAFARNPNVDDLDTLISTWSSFADATSTAERLVLYGRLALRVRRGQLPAWALMPILLGDHDRHMVAAAVTAAALSHCPDSAGPENGPSCVLDHLLTPRARNPGAGLGALLGLGDPRVADMIFGLRGMLAHPDLSPTLDEMLETSSGILHRSTIEFFMNWLHELASDLPRSADLFRRVARGLANRRFAATAYVVIDGQPRYPAPLEGQMFEHGWCVIPLDEYTRSIAARLIALDRAAGAVDDPPEIAGPWGIASERGGAESSSG